MDIRKPEKAKMISDADKSSGLSIASRNGSRTSLLPFLAALLLAASGISGASCETVGRRSDRSLLGTREHTCLIGGACVPTEDIRHEKLDFGAVTMGLTVVRYVRMASFASCSKRFVGLSIKDPDKIKIIATQATNDHSESDKGCIMRIAFVPMVMGTVKSSLTVVAKDSNFSVQVNGIVISNVFRVYPFFHDRVPHRSSFKFNVTVFNPLNDVISIQRIYVTGGPFDLCLPETVSISPDQRLIPRKSESWDLAPFQQNLVAVVTVDTSRALREKAYLRIIMNNTLVSEDMLVPVEMNIYDGTGLFIRESLLDFGIVRKDTDCNTLHLNALLLPNTTEIIIDDIYDETENAAIRVELLDLSVKHSSRSTTIANVTFCAAQGTASSVSGNVIVKTPSETLEIPYRAFILEGSLTPLRESLLWKMPRKGESSRVFRVSVRNNLNLPLTVLKAVVVQNAAFSYVEPVDELTYPVILKELEEVQVASFRIYVKSRISHSIKLQLLTSLDVFEFTVQLYTGELRVELDSFGSWIREGAVVGEDVETSFFVHNFNPIPVPIRGFQILSKCFRASEAALCSSPSNCSTLFGTNHDPVVLDTGASMKVLVVLIDEQTSGSCRGSVNLTTDYENLSVPFEVKLLPGRIRLYEAPVIIDNIFPTAFVQRNLTVYNTFPNEIEMLNIFSEEFPSLKMHPDLNGIGISSHMGLSFDTLTFDGRFLCRDFPGLCYAGFDLETKSEKAEAWKRPFRIINFSSVEVDRRMREKQYGLWKTITDGMEELLVETTLSVTTKEKYVFYLPVTLRFTWPDPIISHASERVEFPLMTVGNSSDIDLDLFNPSSRCLYVHAYVFKDDKTRSWNGDIFSVQRLFPKSGKDFVAVDDERLPSRSRLPTPVKGSVAAIVPAETKFKLRLRFQPQAQSCYDAVLYVRNNLTVVDTIHVYGCGAEPSLKITPVRVDPNGSSLVIDFPDHEAEICTKQSGYSGSRRTVQRSAQFIVQNTGGAHVQVEKLDIAQTDWYGLSFKLMDSRPFILAPKEKRTLTVLYNPDFGMKTKKATLNIFTQYRQDPFTLDVVGTIGPKAMQKCGAVFGRGVNDFWFTLRFHWHQWGWLLHYFPILLLSAYILIGRKCLLSYMKTTAKKRLEVIMERSESGSLSNRKGGNGGQRCGGLSTRPTGSTDVLQPCDILPFVISQLDKLPDADMPVKTYKEDIEPRIPEDSRELISVLFFHSALLTYMRHISLPKSRSIRLFLIVEALLAPVQFVFLCISMGIPLVAAAVNIIWRAVGLVVKGRETVKSGSVATGKVKDDEVPVVKATNGSPKSANEKQRGKKNANVSVCNHEATKSSATTFVEHNFQPPKNSATSTLTVEQRIRRTSDTSSENSHSKAETASSPAQNAVDKGTTNLKQNRASRKDKRAVQLRVEEQDTDRDSSSISNRSDSLENDRKNEKTEQETVRPLYKPKTQKKAAEKPVETKAEKVEEEKPKIVAEPPKAVVKAAAKVAPSISGFNAPTKPIPAQSPPLVASVVNGASRPTDATVQVKAILEAFYKVVHQERGILFVELDNEEGVQLVKQLKFNHVFSDSPKVVVENLARSIKTLTYRINGIEVDLALKASVLACTALKTKTNGFKKAPLSLDPSRTAFNKPTGVLPQRNSPPAAPVFTKSEDVPVARVTGVSSSASSRATTSIAPSNPTRTTAWAAVVGGSPSPSDTTNEPATAASPKPFWLITPDSLEVEQPVAVAPTVRTGLFDVGSDIWGTTSFSTLTLKAPAWPQPNLGTDDDKWDSLASWGSTPNWGPATTSPSLPTNWQQQPIWGSGDEKIEDHSSSSETRRVAEEMAFGAIGDALS